MMGWKGTWKNQYSILTCHHKSTKETSYAIMHLQIVCVTDVYDHALAILSFSPSLTSSVVLLIICFP
jgi:hypothetical protein